MSDDGELLERFVNTGDQAAFGELVARHINLVYSTALRRLGGDLHLAEDVAQTVFSKLAWRARAMPRSIVLAGWLHETTRFAAGKIIRTERRRQAREQEALTMQGPSSETAPDWERLCPILDTALGELRTADRDALLMRYFQDKNLSAVGNALGVSEDAAQKRVSRALEKLRNILCRRGIALPSVVLLAAMAQGAVQAAPPGLAATVAHTSLASASTVTWMTKLLAAPFATKATLVVLTVATIILTGLFALQPRAEQATLNASPAASTNVFHPVPLEQFYQRPLASYNRGQSWGIVPRGLVQFDAVPFQMIGEIEMNGMGASRDRGFRPPRVGEIPVERRAARLHVLGAAGYKDPDGTPVAELRLHYTNGQRRNIFIRYGDHVRNMHAAPDERRIDLADPRSRMVWNDVTEGDKSEEFRLFKSIFDNPLPQEEIRGIELLSLFGKSFFSLCAITLEEPTANAPAPEAAKEDPNDSPYRRETVVRVLDAQNGRSISNAVLTLTVTDINRTYGFGRYRSDGRGQILIDYPPGKFSSIHFQLAASGYLPLSDVETNGEGLLPAELPLRCTSAPAGTAVITAESPPASTRFVQTLDSTPPSAGPRQTTSVVAPQATASPKTAGPLRKVAIAFGLGWLLCAVAGLAWGVHTVKKKPGLGWALIGAAGLQLVLIGVSALCFQRLADLFAPPPPATVASFKADFRENVPKPGWSYLWNPNGVIGHRSNYAPLQWDGQRYQASADEPYPARSASHYLRITRGAGHPGGGLRERPNDIEHYVIVAFTVPRSARYAVAHSQVAPPSVKPVALSMCACLSTTPKPESRCSATAVRG
jgi:RNA polymerase sigma factor (sigma-70 family)